MNDSVIVKHVNKAILALLPSLSLGHTAFADTISYSHMLGTHSVFKDQNAGQSSYELRLNATDVASLEKFDAHLGVLNSVSMTVDLIELTTSAQATFRDDDIGAHTKGEIRFSDFLVGASFSDNNSIKISPSDRIDTCSENSVFTSWAECTASLPSKTSELPSVTIEDHTGLSHYLGLGSLPINLRKL